MTNHFQTPTPIRRSGKNSPNTCTVTAAAAEFIDALDTATLPPEIVEKARTCVFYGFGIGLACLKQSTAAVAAQAAVELDGAPGGKGAAVLLDGRSGSISTAAFSNAVLLHSRCQEDTSGTAHLGVAVLPVALALLEAGLADKESFIAGIVAGYEVAGALEAVLGRDTMAAGFRASPLYGTIAAAAASAKMMKLDQAQIGAALANAASFTGGTLQSIPEGSDEWRYQAGLAARNGLLGSSLALCGAVAARRAYEGGQGFAAAYARKALASDDLELGRIWRLPQVTFKPYPVCAHNQAPTLVAAQVHARFKPHEIKALRVRINPYVVPGMLERGPFSRVPETLMSTYFCCASASVYGTVTMSRLACYDDPGIAAMLPRLSIVTDPAVGFPSAAADVTTHDGATQSFLESRSFCDFSLNREQVRAQLLRLAEEEKFPADAVDLLHGFAFNPDGPEANEVTRAYGLARSAYDGDMARRPT